MCVVLSPERIREQYVQLNPHIRSVPLSECVGAILLSLSVIFTEVSSEFSLQNTQRREVL